MPIPIVLFIPVETPSLTNQREHWSERKKRAALHRSMVHTRAIQIGMVAPDLPCEVILTRVSPRPLDDDNLRGALKHVRDGIAAEINVDDRDPRVRWHYEQERGKPIGVRVTIGELPVICPTCGRKTEAA